MGLLEAYIIFALATGLAYVYSHITNVIRMIAADNPDDNVVTYKTWTYIVFFCVGVLLAPYIVFVCFIPSVAISHELALVESLGP